MMGICWYCDTPIDVHEASEGHPEIHAACLADIPDSYWQEAR